MIQCRCGNNTESYEHKQLVERKAFEANITERQKHLVRSFLNGTINQGKEFHGITGGFYCLWKLRDRDIYPYGTLNDIFRNGNFKITNNSDSLKYMIVAETVTHEVGIYTNGGTATKIETIISVIEVETGMSYTISRNMGGDPPKTIKRSRGSKTGDVGSVFDDEEIYNLLKQYILP